MAEEQKESPPIVEIGWIIAGRMEEVDRQAVEQARAKTLTYLEETLPNFEWKIALLRREELVTELRVEPVELLDDALTERNIQHWDATVLITAADLISRYKSDTLGILSRSLEAIIVSTRRIDPRRDDISAEEQQRLTAMAGRLQAMILHLMGRLYGLSLADDPTNWMYAAKTVSEFDSPNQWSENQIEQLTEALREVADVRLEEKPQSSRSWPVIFYISSAWINLGQILQAVRKAEPWKFPFRLNRLSAAAVSAMIVLLVTAEVWELGMGQNGLLVAGLSLVAIVMTTWYVLVRQKLFVRRQRPRLTEQNVVTNLCTAIIVLTGIATTYLFLFLLTLVVGGLLYSPRLVRHWAESVPGTISWTHYLTLAGLVAMFGIVVGALGASFEGHHYFRHVTYVDEEL